MDKLPFWFTLFAGLILIAIGIGIPVDGLAGAGCSFGGVLLVWLAYRIDRNTDGGGR